MVKPNCGLRDKHFDRQFRSNDDTDHRRISTVRWATNEDPSRSREDRSQGTGAGKRLSEISAVCRVREGRKARCFDHRGAAATPMVTYRVECRTRTVSGQGQASRQPT
ncbi:hypothetical protein BHM03_00033692 [Ensete ventricosum]|nr:hypothetical protein BHM03_00033692 [Ensete ventricosum]